MYDMLKSACFPWAAIKVIRHITSSSPVCQCFMSRFSSPRLYSRTLPVTDEGIQSSSENWALKILQELFRYRIIYRNMQSLQISVTWTRNDRGLLKLEFCLSEQGKSTHNLRLIYLCPNWNLKLQGREGMVLVTNKSIARLSAVNLRTNG
jgi:hypothetical protein